MSCKYAIVCSDRTTVLWPTALKKLKEKYEAIWPKKVKVISYQHISSVSSEAEATKKASAQAAEGVYSSLAQLSDLRPYFTCFLTHFEECDKQFVWNINRLTRELDKHNPYSDTIWGILTGFCEENVLSSLDCESLTITRVLANCPIDLEKFNAGVWFSEMEQGTCHQKRSHRGTASKERCPDDTTEIIVHEISTDRRIVDGSLSDDGVDMIISSGHATESDWHIAYCFEGGSFCSSSGILSGITTAGDCIKVSRTKTPKILCASGNCLMSHISNKDCMALGWMHSGNVKQMVGYVEPTWFGYGGWGVNKYFINNPGSKTFAESFFANQQSLLYQLQASFQEHLGTNYGDHREVYGKCFNTTHSGMVGLPRECSGLVYDRDNIAFYGDPAWKAALKKNPDVDDYR